MQDVLREILKSQAHVAAGIVTLWFAIGAVLGFLAGLLAFAILLRTGALRLEWRHATWLRALSAAMVLTAGVAFGSSIGGCEGTLRATERVVRESQFRTQALKRAGESVAAALMWTDFALENHLTRKELTLRPEQAAAVEAFVKSQGEFDLSGFRDRMSRTQAEVMDKVTASAAADVRARLGLAAGGVPDRLMVSSLGLVMDYGVRGAVAGNLEKHGLKDGAEGLFRALDEAGKVSGTATAASFPELTEAIIDRSLIPLILTPARALARGPQITSLILMVAVFLLPAAGFLVGRRWEASRKEPAAAPA